jgi:F0F1-type ATP synthase membrane subunit b/b'
MEILHQLGDLFLEALPTIVIVLLFYFFLRWAFFSPIQKAMAERTARIEGARAEAAALVAEAKQELDTYDAAIRKVRGQVYAEQETARQAVLDERTRLLAAMRHRVQEDVRAAKQRIATEADTARAQIELESPALAQQIAQTILHPRARPESAPR